LAFVAALANGAAALAQGQSAAMAPPADFGSPPSGQIPILFNDHHVYAKPDTLKQGRVLAALVRGGTVLIPLRSMFEQMGATVTYDASSRTVDISKPGADVKVTVGKPEVIINDESRPLDVPPIIWRGHVLVPIRVISEGMGAYVQWVPDKQVVVVRYIPPTPPPTPTPPPPPPAETAAPAPPPPTPAPAPTPYLQRFIAGDYMSPKVYNEFSNGSSNNNSDGFSYSIHGEAEFPVVGLPLLIGGDLDQYNYQHTCGIGSSGAFTADCYVSTIGGAGTTAVPAFGVKNYLADAKLGVPFFLPHVYVDLGYLWMGNNAGYPKMSGEGSGIELVPELNRPFSVYGDFWYLGNVKGTTSASYTGGASYKLIYAVTRANIGVTYSFQNVPLFLEAGYKSDFWRHVLNAPANVSEAGPYVGLGLRL